jgi:NitT/TauT family transport system permease protein
MSNTAIPVPPGTRIIDGTDAGHMPVFARERTVFGIAASTWPTILAPALLGVLALIVWEVLVRWYGIIPQILPGPVLIGQTLATEGASLLASLWITMQLTLAALVLAVVLGVAIAILFSQSKWLEMGLFPYAIVLQVTPIVAITPLIVIWTNNTIPLTLLICAWLIAFFPILSNTIIGLNSVDHNLLNLFQMYGASRWQTLRYLRLPAAMPYFLGGLKISGGLALIGAVVAEYVAGTGGAASGIAFRILDAGYQLKIPRMFAALFLVSLAGIAIFLVTTWISSVVLSKWHESAVKREN